MASRPPYAFLEGEIRPWDGAKVHVSTVGFKFGTGVFEGVRGYWNDADQQMYLFRLDEHLDRLVSSQLFMRFETVYQPEYVADRIKALVRANKLRETVHIMATVYVSGFGGPVVCSPVDLAIVASPGVRPGFAKSGCRVQVSSWRRLSDDTMPVRIKCNANYQNGRIAALQARTDGYDTALIMNSRGKIAEGPGMCFFMIRDGVAVTPGVTSDILESITRDTVVGLLGEACGLPVVEREIDRTELVSAQEAFFCGTAWEITPVTSVDGLPVGDGQVGPMVRRLQSSYHDLVTGACDARPEWRIPVY
jgi:branched-chain amino acid aminotransferase